MLTRTAIVASPIGLHARTATDFSRKVIASGVPIVVGRPAGVSVNGASVLAVMALGIRCGERIVISTERSGAEEVLNDLVGFLETEHAVATTPFVSGLYAT